ncbi:unnamed protein product [Rotaria magnacalcarata]
MTCTANCSQVGICSFNNTCICPPCFMGNRCETSTNVIQFSLTFAIQWDIETTGVNSNFNIPQFIYTFVIAAMLVMALTNNIACLQTFMKHDIRSTNCGLLQITYCIAGLITIIGLEFRMLTIPEFNQLTQSYSYRYAACNVIPVIVIIMVDICMWLSSALIVEFVLLECFNFNLYRSRRFAVISSISGTILTIGTHFHEIIARRPLPDPIRASLYSCTFAFPLPLDIIDKTLRVCHVILPLTVHFLGIIVMIVNITRRTLLVHSRDDFFHVFIEQCIKRKHFFVPPFLIILSNLPHLILHLKGECEDARNINILRLHIAFNILIYLPPSITFFVYIFPSKSYMHQFQTTPMGRWLKRIYNCNYKRNIRRISIQSRVISNKTVFSNLSFSARIIEK